MPTAKQTPVSELPRAIAEAIGYPIIEGDYVGYTGKGDMFLFDPFNPVKFHELFCGPETHAKICGVLDEWFSQEPFYTNGVPGVDTPYSSNVEVYEGPGGIRLNPGWKWYNNPTYLTENGGWRAWWLRAYLQVLLDKKGEYK